jgi:biopolymer transport protein ExbD
MQFTSQKRRRVPQIIIVALIDVLIVVLIFLMVTTTFKKQPALKLALAESNEARSGASAEAQTVVVTIPKSGPIYLENMPVTYEALTQRLKAIASTNSSVTLAISADTDSSWGEMIKVRNAARDANIKNVTAYVKKAKE